MICFVVLQSCFDFVDGGTGSCSQASVTCDIDGTEDFNIKVEEVIDIKDEMPEAIKCPPIQTEIEVRLWGVCKVMAAHAFRSFIAAEAIVKLHLRMSFFMLYCGCHIPFAICIVILKRKVFLEVLAINGMIIMKHTLKKKFWNKWTASIWR